MPRAPDDRTEKAYELYKQGLKPIDIADKLNIPEGTIRSWKNRQGWDDKMNATLQTNECNVANKNPIVPQKSKSASRQGAPKGNKNAKGNSGGRAPDKNKNAEKHGLYAKYLPAECLDFFNSIDSMDPIDMLWDQIRIKYISIIRSQSIMHVKDKEDLTKVLKRQKKMNNGWEKEYELQFAWDKQANFLNAQSKAMAALTNMIVRYDELLHKNWETVTEEQRARIDLMKANIDKINGTGEEDEVTEDWMDVVLTDGDDD